jgi:hypothetical protein
MYIFVPHTVIAVRSAVKMNNNIMNHSRMQIYYLIRELGWKKLMSVGDRYTTCKFLTGFLLTALTFVCDTWCCDDSLSIVLLFKTLVEHVHMQQTKET